MYPRGAAVCLSQQKQDQCPKLFALLNWYQIEKLLYSGEQALGQGWPHDEGSAFGNLERQLSIATPFASQRPLTPVLSQVSMQSNRKQPKKLIKRKVLDANLCSVAPFVSLCTSASASSVNTLHYPSSPHERIIVSI